MSSSSFMNSSEIFSTQTRRWCKRRSFLFYSSSKSCSWDTFLFWYFRQSSSRYILMGLQSCPRCLVVQREQMSEFSWHQLLRQIRLTFSPLCPSCEHSMYLMTQLGISSFIEKDLYPQNINKHDLLSLIPLNPSPFNSLYNYSIQMSNLNKNCSLHSNIFEYFCQKCLEPVCKQCTMTGPHNTPIHSITSLPDAYERRVHEIKQRIAAFLENKDTIMESIDTLNGDIEQLKLLKEESLNENQRYRSKMLQELHKHEERIRNEIEVIIEEFQVKLNEVNDLGHIFQNIQDNVQIIASHSSLLQSIKQCLDRLNILLDQKNIFPQMPKELSDLRLDLKTIQTFQELITQKAKIIRQIFSIMDEEKAKIEKPTINYESLLQQLSINIENCIEHNVCHYCGTVFSINTANTPCPKNNSALDINEFVGFCSKKPDSIRWATHRHYFGPPAKKDQFYKTTQTNSFSTHLKALLLKLKTICLIKKINLSKQFTGADKGKSGTCNRIEMTYILMEGCGLSADQNEIMLTLCDQPSKDNFTYESIINRLSQIDIDSSQKKINISTMNDILGTFTV